MFKEIEMERCKLRLFRESDLQRFVAYRSLPEIARFQSWTTYTYKDAMALFADISSKPFGMEGEWYQLALADNATDGLIGDLAVHFVKPQVAEVGFTIAPGFQGKGFAKEGLRGLLKYLFDDLGYKMVLAVTDTKNLASIGVLLSIGFEREEIVPRKVMFKGELGEEFDYFYSSEKWLARNN